MIKESKSDIRKKVVNYLKNQKEEARFRKSLVILDKLIRLPEFKKAQTILFYASIDGEVDTFEIMKRAQTMGKAVALPMILKNEKVLYPKLIKDLENDLEMGPYHIPQPVEKTQSLPLTELDLVLVPGLAFDKTNQRLGRGAGYYDRFLKLLPVKTPKIGLAFDFQIFDSLPFEENDFPVTSVITN